MKLNPTALIRMVAGAMSGEASEALQRIADVIDHNDGRITLKIAGTIQNIESDDIHIGIASLRMKNLQIPYADLKLTRRKLGEAANLADEIAASEACFVSYGRDEPAFALIMSQSRGTEIMRREVTETADCIATSAAHGRTRILFSQDNSATCEVLDPASIRIEDEGLILAGGRTVDWDEITGVSVREGLSLALGQNRMLTFSEG